MSLKERIYSVLIVSASASLNNGLGEMLPPAKYDPVKTVSGVSSAKRALAERDYDFVIVNSPLPDEDGMRFSIDTCGKKSTVVLLIVRSEQYDEFFDRAAEFGVFLISRPLSRASVTLAFDWMASARERLRLTEKTVISVEQKMDEIRIVNRAKLLLISELKMAETDAHRYIEKQAMDRCIQKRLVAEEIIKTYG
ncbi:MAG: ANTAR domain-containing protein [Clostridia bacterium]|nr:ANTAR domain-containing protein [Clostridia bacterium]